MIKIHSIIFSGIIFFAAFGVAKSQHQSEPKELICGIRYEKAPHFPCPSGSDDCNHEQLLLDFINRNICWPETDSCVEGSVWTSFDVELDGRLTNFQVRKKLHPRFDEEAVRIIGLMPRWVPGEIHGKKIKMRMNLPIKFRLN